MATRGFLLNCLVPLKEERIGDRNEAPRKLIMFAARRASSLLARRSALSRAAISAPLLVRMSSRGYSAAPSLALLPPPPLPMSSNTAAGKVVAVTLSRVIQPSWWLQKISGLFETAIFQMSSTMKKRRSKMNKHKLRKRRKLLRRKSNG